MRFCRSLVFASEIEDSRLKTERFAVKRQLNIEKKYRENTFSIYVFKHGNTLCTQSQWKWRAFTTALKIEHNCWETADEHYNTEPELRNVNNKFGRSRGAIHMQQFFAQTQITEVVKLCFDFLFLLALAVRLYSRKSRMSNKTRFNRELRRWKADFELQMMKTLTRKVYQSSTDRLLNDYKLTEPIDLIKPSNSLHWYLIKQRNLFGKFLPNSRSPSESRYLINKL